MFKDKLHNARGILSPRGWVVIVALAWLIAPVGVKAQVPASDPEALRAALLEVLYLQQATAIMIGNTEAEETVAQAIVLLQLATQEDLLAFEGLEGSLADMYAKQEALYFEFEAVYALDAPNTDWLSQIPQSSLYSPPPDAGYGPRTALSLTLPGIALTDADYGIVCNVNPTGFPPFVGPNRALTEVVQVAEVAIGVSEVVVFGFEALMVVAENLVTAAETVRDIASRGCDQVVVAFGAGGNLSTACIVVDAVFVAAKAFLNAARAAELIARTADGILKTGFAVLTFCDDDIDSAEIEGAYERASDIYDLNVDIHDDLVAHDAALTAHANSVVSQSTSITAALGLHDLNINGDLFDHNAALGLHDLNIDADLVAHDTNIDADLAAHVAQLADFVANDLRLRRVELAVIEVEQKKLYLLSVTEAGQPISGVQLLALLAGAPKAGVPFQDITGITITTELSPGVLEVDLMGLLPSEVSSNTILQFQVQHDHGSVQHFGTALISGDSNSTFLGSGQ